MKLFNDKYVLFSDKDIWHPAIKYTANDFVYWHVGTQRYVYRCRTGEISLTEPPDQNPEQWEKL